MATMAAAQFIYRHRHNCHKSENGEKFAVSLSSFSSPISPLHGQGIFSEE
jgi:hypothetical protein